MFAPLFVCVLGLVVSEVQFLPVPKSQADAIESLASLLLKNPKHEGVQDAGEIVNFRLFRKETLG